MTSNPSMNATMALVPAKAKARPCGVAKYPAANPPDVIHMRRNPEATVSMETIGTNLARVGYRVSPPSSAPRSVPVANSRMRDSTRGNTVLASP